MTSEAWETSQLGWLPIRLARRPEELETQAQLDALVERAVGQEFSRGNEHHYIVNEEFQWELRARSRRRRTTTCSGSTTTAAGTARVVSIGRVFHQVDQATCRR